MVRVAAVSSMGRRMVPLGMKGDPVASPESGVSGQANKMLGLGGLGGEKRLKGSPRLYLIRLVCRIWRYGFKFLLLAIMTGDRSTAGESDFERRELDILLLLVKASLVR